jgi:hypothetical protein
LAALRLSSGGSISRSPLEAILCRHDGASVVLVDPRRPAVDPGDLLDAMLAVDLAATSPARPSRPALRSRLAPFAVPVMTPAVPMPRRSRPTPSAMAALRAVTVLRYVEETTTSA